MASLWAELLRAGSILQGFQGSQNFSCNVAFTMTLCDSYYSRNVCLDQLTGQELVHATSGAAGVMLKGLCFTAQYTAKQTQMISKIASSSFIPYGLPLQISPHSLSHPAVSSIWSMVWCCYHHDVTVSL